MHLLSISWIFGALGNMDLGLPSVEPIPIDVRFIAEAEQEFVLCEFKRELGASEESLNCYPATELGERIGSEAFVSFQGPQLTDDLVFDAYGKIGARNLHLDLNGVCFGSCALSLITGADHLVLQDRGFVVLTSSIDAGGLRFFDDQIHADKVKITGLDSESLDRVSLVSSRAKATQDRSRRHRLNERLDIMARRPFDYAHMTLHTVHQNFAFKGRPLGESMEAKYGVILTAHYLRRNEVKVIQHVPYSLSKNQVVARVRADLPDHVLSFVHSPATYE